MTVTEQLMSPTNDFHAIDATSTSHGRSPRRRFACLLATLALIAAGCSDQGAALAPVEGRVTLDGRPVARAALVFAPVGGQGGPAYAVTDDDGRYKLAYTHERQGAVVGECLVRIKTGFLSIEDEERGRKAVETIPAKYNLQSELKVDVQPDGGPYDFELTTK